METRKFYRSREGKIIAGVCSGLAKYFDIDPVIMRLIFIVLTVFNGIGLVVYIILALITPYEDTPTASPKENMDDLANGVKSAAAKIKQENMSGHYDRPRIWLGVVVIFIGLAILVNNYAPTPLSWMIRGMFWPLAVIALGLFLLFKNNR